MNDSSQLVEILERAKTNCYKFPPEITGGKLCELIFDGMMCWAPTVAGVLAKQPCSNEYIKSTKKGLATRQCDENGQWSIPEGRPESWTNYSACGTFYIETNMTNTTLLLNDTAIYSKWLPVIKNITQFGYILSIMSLICALFIFIHFKRLHCARNKLHIHLFISFVMRALMSLIKDGLFVKGTALANEIVYIDGEPVFNKENYSWLCKAITSLRNYFIMSNYMFLLMEGAYLHNLLFLNLFSENGVTIYNILGWSLPLLSIIPWVFFKVTKDDLYCWTQMSNKCIALLIDIPIGITVIVQYRLPQLLWHLFGLYKNSMYIIIITDRRNLQKFKPTTNFVLFVIIMRVLFVKLTSMYIQQRRTKYRKLVRATLILVPLFGIPYTISFGLSFYATRDQTFEILWLFFDQTFTAFQGLLASLVYCLLNSEVQVEIIRKYNSFKDRTKELKRRSRTISHTQQIPLTEEMQDMPEKQDHLIVMKTSEYF